MFICQGVPHPDSRGPSPGHHTGPAPGGWHHAGHQCPSSPWPAPRQDNSPCHDIMLSCNHVIMLSCYHHLTSTISNAIILCFLGARIRTRVPAHVKVSKSSIKCFLNINLFSFSLWHFIIKTVRNLLIIYFDPSWSDQPDSVWLKPLVIHDEAGVTGSAPSSPGRECLYII